MSLKFNHDKHKQEQQNTESPNIEKFESESNVRNVCFVLKDGRKFFLNYAYLILGEYEPEENKITLVFSTFIVEMKGHQLESLFEILMEHQPRQIKCVEERYLETEKTTECVVTEIGVFENK